MVSRHSAGPKLFPSGPSATRSKRAGRRLRVVCWLSFDLIKSFADEPSLTRVSLRLPRGSYPRYPPKCPQNALLLSVKLPSPLLIRKTLLLGPTSRRRSPRRKPKRVRNARLPYPMMKPDRRPRKAARPRRRRLLKTPRRLPRVSRRMDSPQTKFCLSKSNSLRGTITC